MFDWQGKVVFTKSIGWESEESNCRILPTKGFVIRICGNEVEVRKSDIEFLNDRGYLNETLVE